MSGKRHLIVIGDKLPGEVPICTAHKHALMSEMWALNKRLFDQTEDEYTCQDCVKALKKRKLLCRAEKAAKEKQKTINPGFIV